MTRSRNLTIGLIIAAVLGAIDIISLVGVGADNGPPIPVLVIGLVLGIITLVGVSLAWRGRRGGIPTVVVSRVLSALSGVPVFFLGEEEEVPDWVAPLVAVAIVPRCPGVLVATGETVIDDDIVFGLIDAGRR